MPCFNQFKQHAVVFWDTLYNLDVVSPFEPHCINLRIKTLQMQNISLIAYQVVRGKPKDY